MFLGFFTKHNALSFESKVSLVDVQTCVLKVNIHCDGCKDKVRKILQKIDGIFLIFFDFFC